MITHDHLVTKLQFYGSVRSGGTPISKEQGCSLRGEKSRLFLFLECSASKHPYWSFGGTSKGIEL